MFDKVLIANRGEIALRVIRACRALGVKTVAVYSEADAAARHVTEADEAVLIGPPPAPASYLNIEAILTAAHQTGVQAIHPGYGFMSENAEFARRCGEAGLVFIGPPPDVIQKMGDKVAARQMMAAAGVPIVPGTPGYLTSDPAELAALAESVGYPLLIKAAAGGGGIGMIQVAGPEKLAAGLEQAQRRAQQAFGNPALYLERYISRPKHIEVQLLGDRHGHLIHLFERECSVQRRHQKVIEESPSPALDPETRQRIAQAALLAGQTVGFQNAGTVEFIMDQDRHFYFLEMNTRIQVEHPVTEMVTGVDLVQEQLKIAAGEALSIQQSDLRQRGHAIECRIYAEDPVNFFPSPGTIMAYQEPSGEHIRLDSWVQAGTVVSHFYDPLLAKLVVWGADRAEAIARTQAALNEFQIEGIKTNLPLHQKILAHPTFVAGTYDVSLLAKPL
ncbi:MAG: acetyl-CoA carboxylase biotin carboxylase subunit [Anaerolineales bacterium]|nr:acetyl-CoA carboxylase biotin carboxylase subunit [Anaerolineales bacterium]